MWATSIGSTFSHRPFPGVRKSGMPEGTEMPAPVSATTVSASRMSSASAAAGASLLPTAKLPPLPLRRALAEEGADPLLRIFGLERRGEAGLLVLDALVEVRVVRGPLDALDGQRRLARELACPRERRVEQLVIRDHAVRQPVGLGLGARDRVADQIHLQGLLVAH